MKFRDWNRADSRIQDRGASLVEVALLVALIALVAIPAIRPIARANNDNICKVVVEGFNDSMGTTSPGDGTCWYFDRNYNLIEVF